MPIKIDSAEFVGPFPTSVKPSRVGVYFRHINGGMYSHWDGFRWGSLAPSVDKAKDWSFLASNRPDIDWSGMSLNAWFELTNWGTES
jgi:hypothetical protein